MAPQRKPRQQRRALRPVVFIDHFQPDLARCADALNWLLQSRGPKPQAPGRERPAPGPERPAPGREEAA